MVNVLAKGLAQFLLKRKNNEGRRNLKKELDSNTERKRFPLPLALIRVQHLKKLMTF